MRPLTSLALAKLLGKRLAGTRLSYNIRQIDLARSSGISVRTLRRLEAGGSVSFDSFLRVVRALELDGGLIVAIPAYRLTPMEIILSPNMKERKRARNKRNAAVTMPRRWETRRESR